VPATPRTSHGPSCDLRTLLLSGVLLLRVLLTSSQAQITLDGSLGPKGPLAGPRYTIPAEVGQIRGGNLFHSFGEFNVRPGERATFTGPGTLDNILGRVTGGSASSIDGLLRARIPGANLYLLNPSGVVFGSQARLDVKGSFHVSTADVVRLKDRAAFAAHLSEKSTLTMAPPAAFGFLREKPAAIAVRGSTLQVPQGETLAVVGGDLKIRGGGLSAPSGQVHLASVVSPGDVVPSAPGERPALRVNTFQRLGEVTLARGARVDASGVGSPGSGGPGGTVLIRGGRLLVDHAAILANTLGEVDGASRGLDLRITDLEMRGGVIFTGTAVGSTGDDGSINLRAERLALTDGSIIDSTTFGLGHGGRVTITATEALTLTGVHP
jgi:filamentous hemagglutinin family protein